MIFHSIVRNGTICTVYDYPKPMVKANFTFTVYKKDYTTSVSLQTYLTICVVVEEVISCQDKPPLFIVNRSESLLILRSFHH
jgi:hypothetical protein